MSCSETKTRELAVDNNLCLSGLRAHYKIFSIVDVCKLYQ